MNGSNDSTPSAGGLALYALILAAVAVFVFSSMQNDEQKLIKSVGNAITYHAFQLLVDDKSEEPGFGMYTYVILPHHVEALDLTKDALTQRYAALLHAIYSSTAGPHADTMDPAHTDMICIPAISGERDPDLNNYNYILAMQYRDYAVHLLENDQAFRNKLSVDFGPFLISTLDPLIQLKPGGHMLLADLSSTNAAAFDEVVSAYKLRLQEGPIGTAEVFTSLRLTLLNWITDANQNLELVKVAYAEIFPGNSVTQGKPTR